MKKYVFAGVVLSMSLCMGLTAYADEWKQDEIGYWYAMDDGSYCADEWKNLNEIWYHFDARGYMQTGWYEENQVWYYLEPSSGAMLSNTSRAIDGIEYWFDASGAAAETQTEAASGDWNGNIYTSVTSNYQITFPSGYQAQDMSALAAFLGTDFANNEFYVIRNDGLIQVAGAYYENPNGLTAAQMCDALQEKYNGDNELSGSVVGRDQLEIGGSTYDRILVGIEELYCDVYLKEEDGRLVMILAAYEPENQNQVDQIFQTLQNVR